MRTWPALLLAPVLALADQVVAFATVGWACAHGRAIAVHAVHALFLAATLATLAPAWRRWRDARRRTDEAGQRVRFLATMGLAVAALSAGVIASMWLAGWFIAPCVA